MKPSRHISLFGKGKNIEQLQSCLILYITLFGDEVEQLKAIGAKNYKSLLFINEYETEVRLATECIERWKEENAGQ